MVRFLVVLAVPIPTLDANASPVDEIVAAWTSPE
jgi:hypothetical protein